MFKCIGTDDDADEPDDAQKQKSNKQYLTLTLLILLPNIGFTIYGAIVLFNARSRPVEHEPIGIGIYPENYCYRKRIFFKISREPWLGGINDFDEKFKGNVLSSFLSFVSVAVYGSVFDFQGYQNT